MVIIGLRLDLKCSVRKVLIGIENPREKEWQILLTLLNNTN